MDLLSHVREHARVNGFATIDLWVIDTNTRAIGLYERGGWLRTDELKSQIETRRIERRFVHRVREEANPMNSVNPWCTKRTDMPRRVKARNCR